MANGPQSERIASAARYLSEHMAILFANESELYYDWNRKNAQAPGTMSSLEMRVDERMDFGHEMD